MARTVAAVPDDERPEQRYRAEHEGTDRHRTAARRSRQEAARDDLRTIFGTGDYAALCQCQRLKIRGWIWRDSSQEERTAMFRAQTAAGSPNATSTSGLVAYVDDDPAGWVAVEPRSAYPKLRGSRGGGLTYHLAEATIDFA